MLKNRFRISFSNLRKEKIAYQKRKKEGEKKQDNVHTA